MTQRKLQEFDEYRYGPRSVLKPGDHFRVGGGPVYVTDDGVEHAVADRGIFKFRRYCVQGRRGGSRHTQATAAAQSSYGLARWGAVRPWRICAASHTR